MYRRTIEEKVRKALASYRAVALVGPRQSGKTTLSKMCAETFDYISLENPDHRSRATEDPRLFLKSCKNSTIFDEIQNVPTLFSYLQEVLDDNEDQRKFILTGSNSFQLNEKISQSLAGRIRIFNILPLTLEEIPNGIRPQDLDEQMVKGFYPRIYDHNLEANEWFASYYQTYLQKDIKMILNVSDSNQFDRFVRLCAGRAGQLGEYASVANELGISQPTAVRWASVLESSFVTFRLSPHFRNFNKRIIKTPKIYFYDTGLLCQLLRINSASILETHPMRGAIFENFIVSEVAKTFFSHGQESPLYFWRDKHGHEIDLLIDLGVSLACLEIKSGSTYQKEWEKNIRWFGKLSHEKDLSLVYGGDDNFDKDNLVVLNWQKISSFVRDRMG